MYDLMLSPHARGTAVEQLHRLVEAVGLVTTVQTSIGVGDTAGVIVEAAPRLAEDHDVLSSGLIMSRVGMYRIAWGVVSHPGGSLAVLAPLPGYEGQQSSDWIRHYMREVLDPSWLCRGVVTAPAEGATGTVTEKEFARAFREAYV
ncbi:hypothetical protein [Streptomyces violaceoruber]|uniref:hypothetical protein n=1 Tax=Streptomyces violaceoruber TaxID=1935 RepID=UPI001F3F5EEE|nr:hypothetical protein [Streptomyces violaceoruber]